jgi:hypothetical protein
MLNIFIGNSTLNSIISLVTSSDPSRLAKPLKAFAGESNLS